MKLSNRLTPNQKKFIAEVIGSVCYWHSSYRFKNAWGIRNFIYCICPIRGYCYCGLYAHFNPAVTIGFLITKHITKIQLVYYLCAEIIGALLGSLFVKNAIGANLGANAPNYSFSIPIVFGIEVLTSALLMAVIFMVVYTKGFRRFGGIAIFFLAFISGASMNPAR